MARNTSEKQNVSKIKNQNKEINQRLAKQFSLCMPIIG